MITDTLITERKWKIMFVYDLVMVDDIKIGGLLRVFPI